MTTAQSQSNWNFLCVNIILNNKSAKKVAEWGFEPRALYIGENEIRGLNQLLYLLARSLWLTGFSPEKNVFDI